MAQDRGIGVRADAPPRPREVQVQRQAALRHHAQDAEEPPGYRVVRAVEVREAPRRRGEEPGQVEVSDHRDDLPRRVDHAGDIVEIPLPERLHPSAERQQPGRVLGRAVVGDALPRKVHRADHEVRAARLEQFGPAPLEAQPRAQPLELHAPAHADAVAEPLAESRDAVRGGRVGGVPPDELDVRLALGRVAEAREPGRVDDERDRGEAEADRPLDDALEVVDPVADVVVAGSHVDAVGFPHEGLRHRAGPRYGPRYCIFADVTAAAYAVASGRLMPRRRPARNDAVQVSPRPVRPASVQPVNAPVERV